MKQTILLLMISLSLWAANPTVVNTHCEEGDTFTTVETGSFESDYLYCGKGLQFQGESEKVVFIGQELELSGKAGDGILAGAETVRLSGVSSNGILSGTKTLDISGELYGTSFVGTKELIIRQDAIVNGDLFVGASEIRIDAPVNGNVYFGAGKVTLNSEINGDATIYAGRLILGENGKITGNLTYSTKEKLNSDVQEKVAGTVEFKEHENGDPSEAMNGVFAAFRFMFKLYSLFAFLVIGLILISFPLGKKVERAVPAERFWKTAGWGLIPMFMYPAVVILAILGGITIPLAFIMILGWAPLFYVAKVIGATVVGERLAEKFNWNVQKRQYHFLIGGGLFAVISIVPVFDFFAVMIISAIGFGIMIKGVFGKKENTSSQPLAIEQEIN